MRLYHTNLMPSSNCAQKMVCSPAQRRVWTSPHPREKNMNGKHIQRGTRSRLLMVALAAGMAGNAGADQITDALRPVSEVVQKGNEMLKKACDGVKKVTDNPIAGKLMQKLLGQSVTDQMGLMIESACRLTEVTSDLNRILSQDSWIGMGREALSKLATGMDPKNANIANTVNDLMAGFESSSEDTQKMMLGIANKYLDQYLGDEISVESPAGGKGGATSPTAGGSKTPVSGGGEYGGVGNALMIDPTGAAGIFGVRASVNGLGSVYANQAGGTQAMERTAENVNNATAAALKITGNIMTGDKGIAATRVHEAETAASMREQMNTMVTSLADIMRILTEAHTADMGQAAEAARLQSLTASQLAITNERNFRKDREEAESKIAQAKQDLQDSYDAHIETISNAKDIRDFSNYVMQGGGVDQFEWADITGLGKSSSDEYIQQQ